MKNVFVVCLVFLLSLSSCIDFYGGGEGLTPPASSYRAEMYAISDLDKSIQLLPPEPIVNSGKIYVVGDLLFVGEARRGFHVFDNADPENPAKINFIQALGSTDLAVRNSTLFINQATDLIALQYNPSAEELTLSNRIRNIFPELRSPDGSLGRVRTDSVIINWTTIN